MSRNSSEISTKHLIQIPIDSNLYKFLVVTFLIAVLLGSTIVNLLIIIAVCQPRIRERAKAKYSRYFIGNMCLANLLLTIIMVPFSIHVTIINKPSTKSSFTQAAGFFVTLFISAMIASTIGITIERLLAVLYPLHFRRCANSFNIFLISAIGWGFSVIIATIPFIGFIFIKYEKPYTFGESFSIFFLISCSSHIFYRSYTVVFGIISYIIPLLFILIAYSMMYHSAKQSSRNCQLRTTVSNTPEICKKGDSTRFGQILDKSQSISSPNLFMDDESIFFNSKKSMLQVYPAESHWRKISANSFFRNNIRASRDDPRFRNKLIRSSSEKQSKKTITRSNNSFNSSMVSMETTVSNIIRKGSKMCTRKIKGLFSQKEELNAAKTCLLVVATFIVLISPYFILLIIQAFHNDSMDHHIFWNTFSGWLIYLNCLITPAMYVYRDSVVRKEVTHLWNHCHCQKPIFPSRRDSIRLRMIKNSFIKSKVDVIIELDECAKFHLPLN